MRKVAPSAAAAREAYEEAGIEGVIRPGGAVGNYHYAKALGAGEMPIKVKVFLLWVERQLDSWQSKRNERRVGSVLRRLPSWSQSPNSQPFF
jgi:8-oxo-dGTP pyrophosphatase MutT (NUDIX family)